MVFNKQILDILGEMPSINVQTIKHILFCIDQEISFYFVKYADADVKRALSILLDKDLVESIPGGNINESVGYQLKYPLYVDSNDIVGFNIDEVVRRFWSRFAIGVAGKKGTKHLCIVRLKNWMSQNPLVSLEQITEACKAYINNCIEEDRLIQDADNFIFNPQTDKSMLSVWIEELEDVPTAKQADSWSF